MFIKEDRETENESKEEKDTVPSLKDDNEVEYPMNVKILVTKYALSMQIKENEE